MRSRSGSVLAGKRIVFLLSGEVLGGAERNALDLASYLASAEGAVVEICSLDDRPGRARQLAESHGIPWTSLRISWHGDRHEKALALVRATRALRRLRPDLLLASTNLPNTIGGLTWRLTGARLFVWNQCDVFGTRRIGQSIFRRALKASPLVITTAAHAREWLVENGRADPGRVHVVRSWVTLPAPVDGAEAWRVRLGVERDGFVACMVAHLHAAKDHETLLRAWRLVVDALRAEGREAALLLAGRPAGSENSLKAIAFDLDLRASVLFLGEVTDISGLLSSTDLAVFSSRSECLGRGATEPMFAGLAVVGTDVPGIREAVGEQGWPYLAPPGDARRLADAILALALDDAQREHLGAANGELIRDRQSREATTERYCALLADALEGRLPAVLGR